MWIQAAGRKSSNEAYSGNATARERIPKMATTNTRLETCSLAVAFLSLLLREEREHLIRDMKEGNDGVGRLPAERGRARRGVYEHEREIEAERKV